MKAFAIILLCIFAAVQGRSAGVQSTKSAAALGENPWLVHLRIAVSTSGLLNTCAGSLIDQRWVLTSASCLSDARFIWIRYGVVDVISPSLVTESSAVRVHPEYNAATGENDIALISINRAVHSVDNVAPIGLAQSSDIPSSGRFCGFGEDDSAPGETLSCFGVSLSEEDGKLSASSDAGEVSEFDIGAAVVNDGVQIAVVVGASSDNGARLMPVNSYVRWIEETANISLSPEAVPEPEDNPVIFVN
ncbi:serine protease 28 [Manduca sexta]|uniref:serine protease 28 n=1 Tax=Manduca sexta TaxID=7130 RepID=UPI00188F5174|nr:serine protease 28 [Manduca sexta]